MSVGGRIRSLLPPGMGPVAVGVVVSATSAYLFLVLTARHLGPSRYAPLAAFWSLAMLVGPGAFATLERDVGRRIGQREDGTGCARPVARYGALIGAGLTIGIVALCLPFGGTLSAAFDHDGLFVGAFLIGLPFSMIEFLCMGIALGNAAMRPYAVVVGAEGSTRIALAVVLTTLGLASPGALAVAVVAGPAVAGALGVWMLRAAPRTGAATGLGDMVRSCGWQLLSILLWSVLVNAGPLLVGLLASRGQRNDVAPFLTALVMVRVPLLLYNSAGPSLLTLFVGHTRAGDWHGLSRYVRRLCALLAGVGAVGVVVAWVAGPAVLREVFGSGFALPGLDIAVLAVTVVALIATSILSLVLTAVGDEHVMAVGYLVGFVVLAVTVVSVPSLLARVEGGLLAGAVASALCLLFAVLRSLHRRQHGVPAPGRPAPVPTPA